MQLINRAEVQRAYQLLAEPGQVVEVRALEASFRDDRPYYKQTIGGFFNNIDDLMKALQRIQQAQGIYITLQELDPDLLHRAKNKIIPLKKDYSTPDKNVKRYRLLPLDSDVIRDVKEISATDAEHEAALAHSQQVKAFLKEQGFPDPIEADSGNGAHLLYAIDLETSAENSDLLKRVLKGICAHTATDSITIDTSVFNPSRIWKLYGTLACKGDNTSERPHRMARILEVPEHLEIVSRELLEAIAVQQLVLAASPRFEGVQEKFSAEAFIQKHSIDTYPPTPYQGGTRWLLKRCVWDSSHTDHSACIFQFADGRLGASCSHNSCQGKGWRELRVIFEPDAYVKKIRTEQKPETLPTEGAEGEAPAIKQRETTAQMKLMWIAEKAHYISTAQGALYARVPVNGHHEVVSINEKGSGFRRWLVYQFQKEHGFVPNSDALSQTMAGIQAIAEYEGEKAKVYTRIAEKNGKVYLDLCNDKWECIEISQEGWRVIACPPIYFRRPNGMLPLPIPHRNGSLSDLRKLINAQTEKDYILITSWLVGALHPTGPYAALNLNGERGSAKSKTTTILRNLIDPNEAPTRNAPKDERDAAIAAQNNMVVALDNLSHMPLWLSDVLCRVATGSGFATRALYANDDEMVFSAKRPIVMNGIEDGIITQGDLLNRTMLVTLAPPSTYIAEEDIDELFRELHPKILGGLLNVIVTSLKNRRKVTLEKTPRMADFAKWVTAAEPALKWEPGTFINAYLENQDSASSIIMEASPVAKALVQFMENHSNGWEGLTQELHNHLMAYEVYKLAKTAPKAPNKLSGQLKRIAPSLRIQGIDIQQPPRRKEGSWVVIGYIAEVIDVDKPLAGVDKPLAGVDKMAPGVDRFLVSTPPIDPQIEPEQSRFFENGVGNVDTYAPLSDTLSSGLVKEIKENIGVADRERNLSTSSTPTTPIQTQRRSLII